MVGGRLRRAVRAVRVQRGVLGEEALGAEGAVDLVRTDLEIPLSGPPRPAGVLPGRAAALQEVHRAEDVRPGEDLRPGDRAVDVGLGGEVDDEVGVLRREQPGDEGAVADIAPDEAEAGVGQQLPEVVRVPGVGQGVEAQQPEVRMPLQHVPEEIRADESGAAGDEDGGHGGRASLGGSLAAAFG